MVEPNDTEADTHNCGNRTMKVDLSIIRRAYVIYSILLSFVLLSSSQNALSSTLQFAWESSPTTHDADINITIDHNDPLSTSNLFTNGNSHIASATSFVFQSGLDTQIDSFNYQLEAADPTSFASLITSTFEFHNGVSKFNLPFDTWFVSKYRIYQTALGNLVGSITDVNYIQSANIPLPAPIWFVGSALLGLLGFSRKNVVFINST